MESFHHGSPVALKKGRLNIQCFHYGYSFAAFQVSELCGPVPGHPRGVLIRREIEKSFALPAAVRLTHAKENSHSNISFCDRAANLTTAESVADVARARAATRRPWSSRGGRAGASSLRLCRSATLIRTYCGHGVFCYTGDMP